MTRAAGLGSLQHLIRGASGARTYFATNYRATFASRSRPVRGLNPGSTALDLSRGAPRAKTRTVARLPCLEVA